MSDSRRESTPNVSLGASGREAYKSILPPVVESTAAKEARQSIFHNMVINLIHELFKKGYLPGDGNFEEGASQYASTLSTQKQLYIIRELKKLHNFNENYYLNGKPSTTPTSNSDATKSDMSDMIEAGAFGGGGKRRNRSKRRRKRRKRRTTKKRFTRKSNRAKSRRKTKRRPKRRN